ncbi:MAG: TetR/AcrR family transcriptional regulator [Deltaproteobacteria bacterium]|nr:TetR/AcrR family transcriptional regulator [Deltaproteobacteria bacterium]
MGAREKILEVAARLFAMQGFRATSLAQVARAAHVSKALVLWHFESKEQLFHAALQHFLAPYEILDQGLDGLTESDQLERLINDYYEFVAEHLSSVKFFLGQVVRGDDNSPELVSQVRQLYHVYRELLASILERGKVRGVFAATVQPQAEAALLMASLNGLLVQRLVEDVTEEQERELLAHFQHTLKMRLTTLGAPAEVVVPPHTELRAEITSPQRAGRQ